MLHAASRARLSGMVITGSTRPHGSGTELHRDTSNVADCKGKYTDKAYPVCQDIIWISITGDQILRYVKISTKSYLTLCEVEVFGGKFSNCFITYFSGRNCIVFVVGN